MRIWVPSHWLEPDACLFQTGFGRIPCGPGHEVCALLVGYQARVSPHQGGTGKDGVAALDESHIIVIKSQAVVVLDSVLCAGQIGADKGGLVNTPTVQPPDIQVLDAEPRSTQHPPR